MGGGGDEKWFSGGVNQTKSSCINEFLQDKETSPKCNVLKWGSFIAVQDSIVSNSTGLVASPQLVLLRLSPHQQAPALNSGAGAENASTRYQVENPETYKCYHIWKDVSVEDKIKHLFILIS